MFKNIDWTKITDELNDFMIVILKDIIVIVLVFFISRFLLNRLTAFTTKFMDRAQEMDDKNKSKDLATSMTLVRSVGRYAISFLAIIIIVNQLGFQNVFSNVITAAGVGALVISLGAQSIIQDMLAGLFLMFEKQFGVGDYVKIGDYEGTVTSIAMRCTYLKNFRGEKIIVPNGQIKSVINYSNEFNMAIIEVPTPYEANTMEIVEILKDVAWKYYEEHRDICYDVPNVVAIAAFQDSAVQINIYIKAKERNHYKIQNDMRLLVKERFDKEGISIPYNQIVVHQGE